MSHGTDNQKDFLDTIIFILFVIVFSLKQHYECGLHSIQIKISVVLWSVFDSYLYWFVHCSKSHQNKHLVANSIRKKFQCKHKHSRGKVFRRNFQINPALVRICSNHKNTHGAAFHRKICGTGKSTINQQTHRYILLS